MTKITNTLSPIFNRLTSVCILFFFAFIPMTARAQYYYTDYYYADEYDYMEYYSYESNVQDAFAAHNPTPSQINGRHNASGDPNWGGDGYGDNPLHPSDPLPLGDHTILFVLAAITAMVIFLQQRKRKALNATGAKTLFVLFGLFLASNSLFAQSEGDLRILYVEQILEQYTEYTETTEQQKNRIVRTHEFESDIVKKSDGSSRTTVSMHIYNKIVGSKEYVNNPEIILQKYESGKWKDIEAHMVFGPLRGNAGIGLLPGRKNAAPDSDVDDFVYDNGIEIIKKDQTYKDKGYRASGVWNFIVVQEPGQQATFDMTAVERYQGDYYVRVNGDTDYKNAADLVSESEYAFQNYGVTIGALKQHDYTHYACKLLNSGSNVKFTIACDYSTRLAKELVYNNDRFSDDAYGNDIYVNTNATLPAKASVRFSWDIMTNRLTRAYIAYSTVTSGEYLVAHGNNQTPVDRHHFQDNTNWMYSADVTSAKGTPIVVRAKYNNQNQFFWGNSTSDGSPLIADDNSGDTKAYPIRIIYDFKDHRLVTIYKPDASTDGEVNLNTPVMIHRVHNDPATEFIFPSNADKAVANGDTSEDKYTNHAYGVLTFCEDKFAATDQHGNDDTSVSHYEKMFYWVSFPFNVNIKDIFGLGEWGGYWAIQYYDGAGRALNGLPTESSTAWKYMPADGVLLANTGYVVCLNYKRLSKDYNYTIEGTRKLSLYFPSANRVNEADVKKGGNITVNLEEYTKGDRIAWNHWNWHLLGVPSFANTTQTDIPFYYEYDHAYDGYGPAACNSTSFFSPMHAYMVQYAGDVNWTGIVNITPRSIAARQTEEDPITLRLELIHGDRTHDKTFIQLRDDKGTKGFDLNLDLTKIINKGANIYSVVNGDQMAGNAVPREESIIPLGVVITEAGDYTFAMPEGTNGVNVELIDYETGISTPLAALNYTVNLGAGNFENRFAVRIQPDKVSTGVEEGEVQLTNGNAQKLIIDGALYLVKDGVLYDAQGKLVR